MLKIVCVKWGTLYGPEYVNILYDMVLRNFKEGTVGEFICFTDDPTGLNEGIKTKPLPGNLSGWWNKLYLFKEGVFEDLDRIIYFDLDTVITGPIDELAQYNGNFAILRDFYRPFGVQSSVMLWEAGRHNYVWDCYELSGYPDIEGGDQIWIEQLVLGPDILQDLFPKRLVSYKVHAKQDIPRGASVVVFHGHPRPHEVTAGWVPQIWKIGGGSALEIVSVGNVEEEKLAANIKHALTLDIEWLKQEEPHDRHAVIVGGGPSLRNFASEIRSRQQEGQTIFSVNGSWQWLHLQWIDVDAHILLDGRIENIKLVPLERVGKRYYASQCDPYILKNDESSYKKSLVLWHHVTAAELIKNDPRRNVLVAGGSTVGLNAISLAYILGYRHIHLYGFDSCCDDCLEHHAYGQPLNDGDRIIDVVVSGRMFEASPWMAQQAEEFRQLMPLLVALGCEITVHGDGLIPHIARIMATEQATNLTQINGIYYPSYDNECFRIAESSLEDLEAMLQFVTNRSIAVQAGGNVGLWPKRLASRHFQEVHTFEPDELNYECLLLNCEGVPGLFPHKAALGEKIGATSIQRVQGNCGANYLKEGNDVEVLTIDNLNLSDCGFIQLDIEGYELKALKGAIETIKKFRPVIAVEDKGLSEKYGSKKGDVAKFLAEHNYQLKLRINRDFVFTPKS